MPFRPNEITKEHVLQAVEKIEREGVRLIASTGYDVIINGLPYPPKEVMRYAHEQLDGDKRWEYPGGPQTFRYLEQMGFEVKPKDDLANTKQEPQYWSYAPGENASAWEQFYSEGLIGLGWTELGDLRQYNSREEITEALNRLTGEAGLRTNDSLANHDFVHTMKVGDVVIPKRGRSTYLGYGIVTSDYFFDEDRPRFKSLRKVNWKKKGEWEASFKIALKTLTNITQYGDYIEELRNKIGIEVSSKRSVWFVCQGDTFTPAVGQSYLFAPYRGARGELSHWNNVRRLQPGEVVFNYASSAIRGISITRDSHAEEDGTKVDIDFFPLEPPITFTRELGERIRRATGNQGPIARDFRTKQGYLFEFNTEGAHVLETAYGKPFPERIRELLKLGGIAKSNPSGLIKVALNQILYGPPGTGKTYRTVAKAVAIIDGNSSDDHAVNKKRFDELRKQGQIEFVTFHQNYSYEDFMIGIRPDVSNENLRFQDQKGIFYQIARRARDNYEQSQAGRGRKRSFNDVLSELLAPLDKSESIPIKMASGISFEITDVSERSIGFTKHSGGHDHTLSISTLREIVDETRDSLPAGLTSYYVPLANRIKAMQDTGEPAEQEKKFVLIIDEINRANISRVFGELITLLENDKRLGGQNELRVTLPNGEKDFGIPPNLYLLGTMNTADKSIALVDVALRRRFEFVGYYPKPEVLDNDAARKLLTQVNAKIFAKRSADYLIGHAYFMGESTIKNVLRHKIIPLLIEYFSGKTEIVEDVFKETDWSVSYNTLTYEWDITEDNGTVI